MAEEKEYDLYERLASVIFDTPLEDVTREQRTHAKTLTWSWAYSIRIPTNQLVSRYEQAVAEMKKLRNDEPDN